jgi:putative Ca2+/H+ antiporter (TMEM165/GDT1 family)
LYRYVAALLAMRLGRLTVLAGATSALGLMSIISVAIGRVFQQIPATITTSLPIGEYLAVALLLFFGVKTLQEVGRCRLNLLNSFDPQPITYSLSNP